jgi:hypothetical protein
MDSSVKTRRNHYETLGLTPDASKDEVARAYARGIGAFGSRSLTDVAAASIAFETLRDPERRRAYDQSIGLGRPAPPRIAWTAGHARLVGPAPAAFAAEMLHARPKPFVAPRKDSPAEPRTASFIAASLRAPVEQAPDPVPVPPQADVPHPRLQRSFDRPPPNLRLADAEESAVTWAKPAMIGGGLIAAVVLVGAVAGWQAGHGDDQQQAEPAVTAALPAPKPHVAAVVPAAAAPSLSQAEPRHVVVRSPVVAARAKQPAAPEESARIEELAEAIQPEAAPPPAIAHEEVPEAAAPAEAAASMPLPHATVARTIERIGYSCGKVASTSAIEGAEGAFKVTCTSGQSYRAAPVHGRYRFRRISGR